MYTSSRPDPYRIERELGRGGMGVVCLAHDPRLGRAVAIKALPDHLAGDPDRLARFEREARTIASASGGFNAVSGPTDVSAGDKC